MAEALIIMILLLQDALCGSAVSIKKSIMKHLIIFLILGLIGCSGRKTEKIDTNDNLSIEKGTNDCPLKEYIKKSDDFLIKSVFASCESDWKYKLQIFKNNKVVYQADSLMEFEFNDSYWSDYLKISNDTAQILLEVNDRPFKNYILCLTFVKDKLISSNRFPLFESKPLDFDNDGMLEYAGYSYTSEGYTKDSCYYNPIIFIEKSNSGLYLDFKLTKRVNSLLFGEFHGFEINQEIKVKQPPIDSLRKYLNN